MNRFLVLEDWRCELNVLAVRNKSDCKALLRSLACLSRNSFKKQSERDSLEIVNTVVVYHEDSRSLVECEYLVEVVPRLFTILG